MPHVTWAERVVGLLVLLLFAFPFTIFPALRSVSPHFAVSVRYFNGAGVSGTDPWGTPWVVSVERRAVDRVAMSVGPNRRFDWGQVDDIRVVYLASTRSWAALVRSAGAISALSIVSLLGCVLIARVSDWRRGQGEGDQRDEQARTAAQLGGSLVVPVAGAWLLASGRLEDLRTVGVLDAWHGFVPLPASVAGTTAACFLAIAWTLRAALLSERAREAERAGLARSDEGLGPRPTLDPTPRAGPPDTA